MSSSYGEELESSAACPEVVVRPLHYLIELRLTEGPQEVALRKCCINDISGNLSKDVIVTYTEDASQEDVDGSEIVSLIPDLDYQPSERRVCSNRNGEGYTLKFGKKGGWTVASKGKSDKNKNGQLGPVNFEDFSLSLEDEVEVQRELSLPFSITVDSTLTEKLCTRVMEKVLDLKQLVQLNLSRCQLPEQLLYGMQFGGAYSLEKLNLDWLQLRRIHPSIGRLRNLKDLSIAYNRISDLPLTIRLLKKLCRLDITGNPFTRLPGAVFHLLGLDVLEGLNECPLSKSVAGGWHKEDENVSWRAPLVRPDKWRDVGTLKEYCIQAAVGMDCWLLSLPERLCDKLSKLAETQGLCENCLKAVQKLTLDHESQGYTIHAQMAVFCGVRDVPFSFMACSDDCLQLTLRFLQETNTRSKKRVGLSNLPCCEYELEFVQDLEELRRQRALRLAALTVQKAQGNRYRNRNQNRSYCSVL